MWRKRECETLLSQCKADLVILNPKATSQSLVFQTGNSDKDKPTTILAVGSFGPDSQRYFQYLHEHRYHTQVVETVDEAIELLKKESPSLVLYREVAEKESFVVACRRLKQQLPLNPLVALTEINPGKDVERSF